ncbi:protoporphyrinogen/coproporphyrinogen oxidase [Naasia lichenicola]|uniref:Protoporphyrinogen oxidase n=1 Tax=Naasia lichenicola TaxID=2565933 RepID=A0A4S4FH24_9MICO|nr:FAD-dependent oxidoreductase [Naasia lichenicola]THG29431.1 protoporphyrinogen oxidase [Naasia lichenicola]
MSALPSASATFDTVVVGGGAAGLVAARAEVLAGRSVALLDAADELGGALARASVADVEVDVGAESFAVRGTAVSTLIRSLGLTQVEPSPEGAWLLRDGRAHPLPSAGVLGIPGFPLADDVRAIIGTRAAVRAYADRLIPELTIGREHDLARLVRRRMGVAVLDDLVRPVVESVYGLRPEDADVDALLPGLNGALTATGSLSSAVLRLRSAAPAGSAVAGVDGGIHLIARALLADLQRFGVEVRPSSAVSSVDHAPGGWRIRTADDVIDAARLVIATDGSTARSLLRPILGDAVGIESEWPAGRRSTTITLAVDGVDALDSAPRGSGVLVAGAEDGSATALTHSSAKWPWLRDVLPPGRHLLRVSFRGEDEVPVDLAVQEAGRLLGVTIPAASVVDAARTVWRQDAARATRGLPARLAALSSAVAATPALAITGAWVAGTGLASVVAHAQSEVARLGAAPTD